MQRGEVRIVPTGSTLGAEVLGVDAAQPVDEDTARTLRGALAEHRVLLLRDQDLGVEQQIRFAGAFGKLGAIADTLLGLGKRGYQPDDIPDCVSVISNIEIDGKAIGSLGDGECLWHSDSCFSETPPSASVLYGVTIPPVGGDTAFLDMVHALQAMPRDLRSRVEGKHIRHSQVYDSTGAPRPRYEEVADVTRQPGPAHPVVRTIPESGQRCLYLGRRLRAYVVGLTVDESEALLDELWSHAVQPGRVWSHRWRRGDLLVWDNRLTMHHRDAFDPRSRRRLHKVQVAGERPV